MFAQDPVTKRISESTLKLWRGQAHKNNLGGETRGRKPSSPAFETALLSELLYLQCVNASEGNEGPAEVRVHANAMFSYGLIRATAQALQSRPTWQADKKVNRLGYCWIRNFLRRNCFTRRRISTVIKDTPSDADVQRTMQQIHEAQRTYGIAAQWVVNLDETGIFYGAAPKYIFETHGARGGEIPDHDEKSRFTVELAATGDGNILPYFIVIKCSAPSGSNPHDFGNMRVIHNLHAEPAFSEDAGWTLKKWAGFKTFRRKKNGQPVQPAEEFEHVRWYLQHKDGHVITMQPKAWMDTGGFAMYIETILAPWWTKQQTSWTGDGPFPAQRMLLVCDNASVHKADEIKTLMDKYGIILMFLPPNMTQWLQPLDRVVCGLVKIVQRARRGRHLSAHLMQWKREQERIVGEALLQKRAHPTLTPWRPPKPTLMQGIFFYQQTHMEELQLEKTKNAIRQVFIDTGITPFQDGRWKQFRREQFTNYRRSSDANQVLSNILKLQDKKCISAYLFSLGLDDQDPAQWGDDELSELVVPEADCVSDSEEEEGEAEEEEELEQQRGAGGGAAAKLVFPQPTYASDSEEEEGEEEEEEEEQQQQQYVSSSPINDTPRKRSRR